jgi:hypothetical protein
LAIAVYLVATRFGRRWGYHRGSLLAVFDQHYLHGSQIFLRLKRQKGKRHHDAAVLLYSPDVHW